jgi:hypothetical protein
MLIIGAGASDSAATTLYPTGAYFLSVASGDDGCPLLSGAGLDLRELCADDLGSGWTPFGVVDVQMCAPGSIALGDGLVSGTVYVYEHIVTEPDTASAIAYMRARVTCDLKGGSKLRGTLRELPLVAIPGAAGEAQLVFDLPDAGGGIGTLVVIGNFVLTVSVSDDAGVPDSATVMRIVNTAINRFQNPRRLVIVPAPGSGSRSPP